MKLSFDDKSANGRIIHGVDCLFQFLFDTFKDSAELAKLSLNSSE